MASPPSRRGSAALRGQATHPHIAVGNLEEGLGLRAQVIVVILTLAITALIPTEAQMRDHHRRAQQTLAPSPGTAD